MVSNPLTYLLAISRLISPSLVGGTNARNNAFWATTSAVTSAWKKKPSTSSCQCYFSQYSCCRSHTSHVRVGGSAFLPRCLVRGKADVVNSNENSSGSMPSNMKLAFLSELFVHHSSTTNTNYSSRRRYHTVQRTIYPHCMHSVQRRKSFALFASKDVGDDECSLQRLYQQVQEEDSEWYKETFAKFFDGDEDPSALIPPCTNEITDAKEDTAESADCYGNSGGGEIESKIGTIEQIAGGSEKTTEGNQQRQLNWKEEMERIRMKNAKLLKGAKENIDSSEATEAVVDSPPLSVSGESEEEDPQMEFLGSSPKQEVEEDEVEKEEAERWRNETPPPQPSAADSSNPELEEGDEADKDIHLHSHEFKRKHFDDDDEYEDVYEHDNDYYYDSSKSNRRPAPRIRRPTREPERDGWQQREQSESLSSAGTSTPAPKAVVLRNTLTEESMTLSPLSALAKLGYSENELVVIKPQVLELIVEDGIQRPSKGLPKRWVRLSRIDGYEGEEEEEDEAYVDWDVEIEAREKIEEAALEEEEGEEEPGRKDFMDNGKDRSEEEIRQGKEEFSYAAELSESWGPFTSSRLANGQKSEVRDEDDYDGIHEYERTYVKGSDAKKQRSRKHQQQSIEATSYDVSYKSRYGNDRGDNGDYDRRRMAAGPPPRSMSRRQQRRGDYDEYEKFERRPRSNARQHPRQRQHPLAARERNLRFDQGSFNGPQPNKFWMDLPTFKSFLRKEAQLRLKILGPDWTESVLDESRWRYDLYKTWLTMLDEGVGGENPLYEYGDRPREPRQRRRGQAPPPRSHGDKRDGYDRSPIGPNRRQQHRRPDTALDEDDESYPQQRSSADATPSRGENRERNSRRRENEPRADSSNRDHWSPPLSRTDHGNSGSTWKNFSDLEESLEQPNFSLADRSRPKRSEYYPIDRRIRRGRRDVESHESALFFGEEEEDAPMGRKRRIKEDMPYEEDFDDGKEGPPPGGRSRRQTVMAASHRGSTSLSGSEPSGSQHRDDDYGYKEEISEERAGNDALPRRRRKDDRIRD